MCGLIGCVACVWNSWDDLVDGGEEVGLSCLLTIELGALADFFGTDDTFSRTHSYFR